MFCPAECAVGPIPTIGISTCNVVTRSGGIRKLIAASCDYEFTDITDLAEWTAAQTSGDVRATGEVLGAKPKGSPTNKKVASCRPEQVTGYDKQINIKDYNADDTNFTDYDFWDFVNDNQGSLVFGYVTCDDLFYGWIEDASVEVDDVREEDVNDNTYFDAIIKYKQNSLLKPIKITGLNTVLV